MSEEFARRLILEYKGYIKELRIEHYDSSSIFIRLFRLQKVMKTLIFYICFVWRILMFPIVYGQEAADACMRFMDNINRRKGIF